MSPDSFPNISKSLNRPFHGVRAAFTLVELLVVVAVLAILAGTGVVAVKATREAARTNKLETDVATLNRAVEVYRASGGELPSVPASGIPTMEQTVIEKLKTVGNADAQEQVAGLRGSMVDPRLATTVQTAAQAAEGEARAVWNASDARFEIRESGAAGVREFTLDPNVEMASAPTETRDTALKLAKVSPWVWDYQDSAPGDDAPGGARPTSGSPTDPTDPDAPGRGTLLAPALDPEPSAKPFLVDYPVTVEIADQNDSGLARIFYSVNGGPTVQYTSETILTVHPSDVVDAIALPNDPDAWNPSAHTIGTYDPTPVDLVVSLTLPVSSMTYAEAGGAMQNGDPQTPPTGTLTISNLNDIPPAYQSSAYFQLRWTYDGSDPLTSETALTGASFSNGVQPATIELGIAHWPANAALTVRAAAVKVGDTKLFNSSPVSDRAVAISPTVLLAPVIDPASGQKAVDYPVTIDYASGQSAPASARIQYTLDGSDPGNSGGSPTGGTLYEGPFDTSNVENASVVTVTARAYGPSAYSQWFTPSSSIAAVYNSITLAEGALVGAATLNGTFVGSLIYASPSSGGSMNNITFNSNAKILNGNLYLPGQPTVRRNGPSATWSLATDSQFASVIQGWEFDSAGTKTVQTTPRVLDEDGSITPNNYTITFNGDALLEGKVIRRHTAPAFPTIAPPPPPDSSGSVSLNSPPPGPISAAQYANVTINTSAVGDVRLLAGHFGNLTANNGTAFVLGDPNNPNVTQIYSFNSLNLNSGASLKVVGKVIVTVGGSGINLNSSSVLGNVDHPEWLQLQMSSGNFSANSGSYTYAQLVAPNGSVTFNAGSIFQGSVTANQLTINSSGVVFNLPPVIEN